MYWIHYNKNSAISLPLENTKGHPVVRRSQTMKKFEKVLSSRIGEASYTNGMRNQVIYFI